jgi:deazaflavin-dependent oxidoreductase (nitroreductase family)
MAIMLNSVLRRIFKFFNKIFMVPMFRLGLGSLVGNPFSGYIMVLKTTGRKSGKIRFSPVNYAILEGNLYCMAGWGKLSDWYRNIMAAPHIEVIHPNGPIAVVADLEMDASKRLILLRMILKNAGFAGFFEGFNPFSVTDEELSRKTANMPLIRLHPVGLGKGAFDPGGWAWLWIPISMVLLIVALFLIF